MTQRIYTLFLIFMVTISSYAWYDEIDYETMSSDPTEKNLDYLCFTAVYEETTLQFNSERFTGKLPSLQYSIDGKNTWEDYTLNTDITLANAGDKVYFRAKDKNETFNTQESYIYIDSDDDVAASGNIMSLLDKTCQQTTVPNDAFNHLFSYISYRLTSAPDLPGTTLGDRCYKSMFEGCIELKEAPKLPAQTLAFSCYQSMFQGCSELLVAPELPAQTLAFSCYLSMFQDCTKLIEAPELPAQTLENLCYFFMFYGCTSIKKVVTHFTDWNVFGATKNWLYLLPGNGEFICSPALDVTQRGASAIPDNWTVTLATQLNSEGYGTFSSAYNTQIKSGANAYTAHFSGDNIVCTKIADNKIPQYSGVLLYGEPNATVTMSIINAAPALRNNQLKPTTTSTGLAETGNSYTLSGHLFLNFIGASYDQCKAFLPHSAYNGTGDAKTKSFILTGLEPTSVASLESDGNKAKSNGKYIKNGHLVIEKDGKLYNTAGMPVK